MISPISWVVQKGKGRLVVDASTTLYAKDTEDILQHTDDIDADFRRILYHPDVAIVSGYVVMEFVIVPVGEIFGAKSSPSYWCVPAEIRAHGCSARFNRRICPSCRSGRVGARTTPGSDRSSRPGGPRCLESRECTRGGRQTTPCDVRRRRHHSGHSRAHEKGLRGSSSFGISLFWGSGSILSWRLPSTFKIRDDREPPSIICRLHH